MVMFARRGQFGFGFLYAVSVAVLTALFFTGTAWSADAQADFDKQIRAWERTIDKIEKRVTSGRTGSLEERELRAQLKAVADAAALEREDKAKLAKQTSSLLEALGAPPGEGEAAESATVKKRRQELAQNLTLHEGYAKQAGLTVARADQVVAKIATRSRQRLKDILFERSVSPLAQQTWAIALPEAMQLSRSSFWDAPTEWWQALQSNAEDRLVFYRNLSIALLVGVIGWGVGLWLRRHFGRVRNVDQPSSARRLLAGIVEGGSRTLGPILFIVLLSTFVFEQGEAQAPLRTVVHGVGDSLVIFFLGYGLINAGLSIRRQEWRILDFDVETSRRLSYRLKLILVTFLSFVAFRQSTAWAAPSLELSSIYAFLFTLTLTPMMIALLGARVWGTLGSPDEEYAQSHSYFPRLRAFIVIGLVALPLVASIGYASLASFLVNAVVLSGLILAGFGLLRSIGREALASSLDYGSSIGRQIRKVFVLNADASRRTLFWLSLFYDLILVIAAGMVLLPVWGLGAEESAVTLAKLVRGIQIGSYTLSIVDVTFGLVLFGVIIFITRLIQKGLDRHILPNLTKDKGVQDALKTGVGYIGAIIAFLVGVAVLGLDLTNLALIAGALSVGLGFGLQNVVNNFVSGLILLAERPIKPGDWVVVGGHEGNVKKVNVRSTEIETFQRASVIIPNADLISNPVTNWTHKNMWGRAEVRVGVAYGTDPRKVEAILIDCAAAHSNVLSYPVPYVLFYDFGDSSLNFELRAYLANVEKLLVTASDLRFAIYEAFARDGIEIPFPQRVVHMAKEADTPLTPSLHETENGTAIP